MKAILTILMGMMFFVSVGGQMSAVPERTAETEAAYEVVRDGQTITGTWYSFPVGTMVRFNVGGTADFGLDESGAALGTHAATWHQGGLLNISFAGYDGASEICETAVGSYEVRLLDGGGISFIPVNDACAWRVNALNGNPDLGFDLVFYPVE